MKIAVVGTCASGKTTIVAELRRLGLDAYVVSQEHSIVRDLWRHLNPDALVVLEADYQTVRQRRGGIWPRWLYDAQLDRLADARRHANVILNTSIQPVDKTIASIVAMIDEWRG